MAVEIVEKTFCFCDEFIQESHTKNAKFQIRYVKGVPFVNPWQERMSTWLIEGIRK